jgi:uncharacterized protein YjiS (DUF1127 family)
LNSSVDYGIATGSLLGTLLRVVVHTPAVWWQRHQAREQLMALDERMLRDIGLTRGDVMLEWQKAFWEA